VHGTRKRRTAHPTGHVSARPSRDERHCTHGWSTSRGADRLAALVDDVHFATRLPKHLVMAALARVAERQQAGIEAEVRSLAGQ